MEILPFAEVDDSVLESSAPKLHSDPPPRLTAAQQIESFASSTRTTFYSLPTEIRFQIYRSLLVSAEDETVSISSQDEAYRLYQRLMSFLVTARQPGLLAVAYEMAEIFWSENRFCLQAKDIGRLAPFVKSSSPLASSQQDTNPDLEWDRTWTKRAVKHLLQSWCRLFLRNLEISIPFASKIQYSWAFGPGPPMNSSATTATPPWNVEHTELTFLKSFPALQNLTLKFVITVYWSSCSPIALEKATIQRLHEMNICKDGQLVETKIACNIKVADELTPCWEYERLRQQSQLILYQPEEAVFDPETPGQVQDEFE